MVDDQLVSKVVRRRGEALSEAIRQAVREELSARGYADLTFEGVAKRAQTSKPVIYRRYVSRAQMVLDAWIGQTSADSMPALKGSLREDLHALGRAFSERLERIGLETWRGVLAEVPPEQIHNLTDVTTSWAQQALGGVLDAARGRGEISAQPLPPRVATLPMVLVRNELLFDGGPDGAVFDDATLYDIIDTICLPLLTRVATNGSTKENS